MMEMQLPIRLISIPNVDMKMERLFLKSFYHHTMFDLSSESLFDRHYSELELSQEVVRLLLKYKCKDLLDIIKEDASIYSIDKSDIPQFSDLNKAFYNVPYGLVYSGIDGVGYAQMGYILREDKRKEVADRKYGENQMKTAEQLGLCKIVKYKAYPTMLGRILVVLSENERQNLLPKLCLYIPFVQNYYLSGEDEDYLNKQLGILSQSTCNRRRPNVNMLIQIINKATKDGI